MIGRGKYKLEWVKRRHYGKRYEALRFEQDPWVHWLSAVVRMPDGSYLVCDAVEEEPSTPWRTEAAEGGDYYGTLNDLAAPDKVLADRFLSRRAAKWLAESMVSESDLENW